MERPFPAYRGEEPYFFVSYAHADDDLIFREMAWLNDLGINLWYDEGIEVGSSWRAGLANALSGASGLLFFATESSVNSEYCIKELNFAVDENIQIFVVNLDDSTLPIQLRFTLSDKQILIRSDFSQAHYREKLKDTIENVIRRRKKTQEPETDLPTQEKTPRIETYIPSICILPFTCPPDDSALTFYAENIATEIASGMESASVNVVRGHSADAAISVQQLGRRHNAEYVLVGTLMRVEEKLRAKALMIEAEKEKQVWARNYEPEQTHLADSSSSIAGAIAAHVALAFPHFETKRIGDVPVDQLDAWALGIKSMCIPIRDHASAKEWLRLARMSVERDGNYADSHANLADGLVTIISGNLSDDPERDKADAIAHSYKALALSKKKVFVLNRCSRVHRLLGNETLALDLAGQVDEISTGQFTYTLYPALILNGKPQEVVDHAKENQLASSSWASDACVILGQYELAETWVRKSVARTPEQYKHWMRLANILGHLEQIEEGRQVLKEVRKINPANGTVQDYESELSLIWRNKMEIVKPLVSGLHALE